MREQGHGEDDLFTGLLIQASALMETGARISPLQWGLAVNRSKLQRLELWFDWPEPDYHAKYAHSLPFVKFQRPTNQLRLPNAILDIAPILADPHASRQAIEQCEIEMALMGGRDSNITKRVRAELVFTPHHGYPSQEEVAKRLNMSSRTLARQLKQDGSSFRHLVEDLLQKQACRLLESSPLEIAAIAAYMGYLNPANFTRAFLKWKGKTPSQYRGLLL